MSSSLLKFSIKENLFYFQFLDANLNALVEQPISTKFLIQLAERSILNLFMFLEINFT